MVSVIIPTYKRAEYITRAIESVLNQTYQDFELIIVDDNNPNTKERTELEQKMSQYKDNSKVKFIQHEKNKNGAAARNTGIKIARGEYITFLDDDDFYLKDRLKILVNELDKNIDYDAVYTGGIVLDKEIFKAKIFGNLQKEILKQQSFFRTGSNMFFRTEVIRELNGFDESFIRHQDLEIMVRFFREHKILNVDKILVVKDDGDRINSLDIRKAIKTRNKFLNTFKADINKFDDKNEIIQANYIDLLLISLKSKERKYYALLKKQILKYGKINIKLKCKILVYFLFNPLIKIIKKFRKILMRIKINFFSKEILNKLK